MTSLCIFFKGFFCLEYTHNSSGFSVMLTVTPYRATWCDVFYLGIGGGEIMYFTLLCKLT